MCLLVDLSPRRWTLGRAEGIRMEKRHGVGFWVGAGVPSGTRVNTFISCGCCGAYHRTDFYGDCREDSERYEEIPEGGKEVYRDHGA